MRIELLRPPRALRVRAFGRSTTVKPYFRWFDIWIGAYWDRKTRMLYLGYFPMLGIRVASVRLADILDSETSFW